MFFDTNISESYVGDVAPSKYEANLEGALMLVYENECNYNALMKAAALSELKYYRENGGDLFVQEAGAFSGFLSKAKDFFKKVLEKIKALFKKFFMTMAQLTNDDKAWVKKYEKDVTRAASYIDSDFTINGHKFGNIESIVNGWTFGSTIHSVAGKVEDLKALNGDSTNEMSEKYTDNDAIDTLIEKKRGMLIGKSQDNFTEDELRDEVKDLLYGDSKESLDGTEINLRNELGYIRDSKTSTKTAQDLEKTSVKSINEIIKACEQWEKLVIEKHRNSTGDTAKLADTTVKSINQKIRVLQAISSSVTMLCGLTCQAIKDRSRQAKAICIKAVGYGNKKKNESFTYSDSSDLFSNVNII